MNQFKGDYVYEKAKHLHNFNKVKDNIDWKKPTLATTVKTELEAEAICEAVEYFTGGSPEILSRCATFKYWVVCPSNGYYVEIGA